MIERWEIDSSHSAIRFAVRHLGIHTVRGRFTRWSGRIEVPDGNWDRATVDVLIDASSIDTGIAARDRHLRAEDYFDVLRHPDITFRTRVVTSVDAARWMMLGELTMKGRAGAMTLDVRDNGRVRDARGHDRVGFLAHGTVHRRAYGVSRQFALDRVMIGNAVEVEIEVQAVRQPVARVA